MDKKFVITALIAIAALGIFVYLFVLGGYQAPTSTPAANETSSTNQQPQQPEGPQATELKVEDIKKGEGPEVKSGDTIVINYKGTLTNGKQFDSSYDRGTPFETKIGVGQVIEGWDKGVVGMQVGGKRKLTIPPAMGYGDQAAGEIPPNSTLIFEVELVGIK